MFQRIVHPGGVVFYQSSLLRAAGVRHAFSTRIGGVSTGPLAALNLGNPQPPAPQDPPENLAANYERLQIAIGAPLATRAWVRQVHQRRVELLETEAPGEYAETLEAEIRDRFSGQIAADGIVTAEKNVLLTIRVADCFALLLASRDGRVVGAAHAGWRGVLGNIVAQTLRVMHEAGARPDEVVAALGPGICARCFEVGPEVAEEFEKSGYGAMVDHNHGPKPHIDLQTVLVAQLQAAGVAGVDAASLCTVENPGEFYSHRRDGGATGRLAAVIGA